MPRQSKRVFNAASVCLALCLTVNAAGSEDQGPKDNPGASPNRAALERQFADTMSGATLIGSFTVAGRENGQPREERYEIERASKLEHDYWLFVARIQYGQTDLKVPITLKVFWAGDTPVITLTDLTIPGLGTFTARVMVYGDRYAGTWQHGKVGGHLWGRIEQTTETAPASAPKPE